MTIRNDDVNEDTDRQGIDMQAAAYIERRNSTDWTASDEAKLESWLGQNIANRVSFIRLNAVWNRTERLVALRSVERVSETNAEPRNARRYLKYAGVVSLVLATIGASAAYFLSPRYDTYATTVGGRETLTLHDGSKIDLNTNTVVRVLQSDGSRLVRLDKGEAFFQIRHDSKHPFVVLAGGHRLVDLGTQFSVRASASDLQIALVEGSISFEPANGSVEDRQTLLPGDVLVASIGGVSVRKQPLPELTSALNWRRGMLTFHEATLLDAAREFNRYNETKIVISDPRASHETINGTLPANDLEEFSRMARNLFGLKTQKHGNEILFKR